MSLELDKTKSNEMPPTIEGLRFRRFAGDENYPAILDVNRASKEADSLTDDMHTLESLAHTYGTDPRSDPRRDLLLAEIDGRLVAYNRTLWNTLSDGSSTYWHAGFVLPEWRGRGLGARLVRLAEQRLRQLAAEQSNAALGPKFYQAEVYDTQPGLERMLKNEGYEPVRYGFDMVRPLDEPVQQVPLPPGFEVRPATESQFRAIFDAVVEAFQDHWGASPAQEGDFEHWIADPVVQPELWQVAWEGDQVAGSVLNFVNEEFNVATGAKRGYTEGISVRRPWRRRGLARALIARSQQMFKDMGMTEVALNVDTENPSGALQLYESMGYRTVRVVTTYQKPLVLDDSAKMAK